MSAADRLNVIILSPACDAFDVGEARTAYHWISRLAKVCNVTLLTTKVAGHIPASQQLPGVKVIEWPELLKLPRFQRMNSMLKPNYMAFYVNARRWIKQALANSEHFHLVHQLTPLALRYPCPGVGLGLPCIIGPLAGSLPTPPAFQNECRPAPFYVGLRVLDDFRLRYDPWLRRSFEEAAIVLCSSPYVREHLAKLSVKRFEVLCEAGVDKIKGRQSRERRAGELRLLHVGRAVRTKGLRDAVRAMARLPDLPAVTLDAVGAGEELELCQREAHILGVSSKIRFRGAMPRQDVDQLYREADLFLFPSFREPTGIVVLEAMSFGLPVITTDRGGPGHLVDDSCGIRVPVHDPEQFANDLALAIRKLALDGNILAALRVGALARVEEIGLWQNKIDRMVELYRDVSCATQHQSFHRVVAIK